MPQTPWEELLKDEERKMRRLRLIIDLTQAVLMQSNFCLQECLELSDSTKRAALSLFPDKESVYELVYAPRFRRILEERFGITGTNSGLN